VSAVFSLKEYCPARIPRYRAKSLTWWTPDEPIVRTSEEGDGGVMLAIQLVGTQWVVFLGVVVLVVLTLTVRRARSSSDRTRLNL
jgi:hypothetical protein